MELLLNNQGELWLERNWAPKSHNGEKWLDWFVQNLHWRHDKITIFGKTHELPRLQSYYGDFGTDYKYSGILMKAEPWNDTLLELKTMIELSCNQTFNSCLISYYRNGSDQNGWHSDDEKIMGDNPFIASLSFGAERRFQLKKKCDSCCKFEVELGEGDLLLMVPPLQRYWKHQIPRTAKNVGERINLTFRKMLTD